MSSAGPLIKKDDLRPRLFISERFSRRSIIFWCLRYLIGAKTGLNEVLFKCLDFCFCATVAQLIRAILRAYAIRFKAELGY